MEKQITVRNSRECNGKILETCFDTVYRKARFEFFSDRNDRISCMSDVSPLHPGQVPEKEADGMKEKKTDGKGMDIWFPVVDIRLEPGMYGMAEITGADVCHINSYFYFEETRICDHRAVFPGEALSEWENGLRIGSRAASVTGFCIVKEFYGAPSVSRRAACAFTPVCEDWGGTIKVYYQDLDGQWHYHGKTKLVRERDQDFARLGAGSQEEALNLCIEYILNSCNASVNNPYRGGLYLFYDCDADTYRNGQWPWSWGTAVKFLLEAAELAEKEGKDGRVRWSPQDLRQAAVRIGETTLRFVIDNPGHPADGFGTVRYTPRDYSPIGYEELVNAGSDTGFLCGWAWMPLYRLTKDERYLQAAENYLEALDKLLDRFVIPPQEWLPGKGDWTDFTIDESGFGTEGIQAVWQVTGDEKYQALCRKYMDRHLQIFERKDGLWNRQYRFSIKEVEETAYMTRGLGWAMEGLLAAHRCVPEDSAFLEKAVKMADLVLKYQREDGSWGFFFTDEDNRHGAGEKGTALWSLLLFLLYEETRDERHLKAAKRALKWCMEHQYTGTNPHARGGVLSPSGESGVTYRAYFRLCCQYTSSFVGLALLRCWRCCGVGSSAAGEKGGDS